MEKKELKELISYISSQKTIQEITLETDEIKLHIKKPVIPFLPTHTQGNPPPPPEIKKVQENIEIKKKKEESLIPIKSTLIGTFYSAENPESPPFVKIGDRIEKGQVVCIIEAMKLFNEINSEVSGIVRKICVENKNPVEYDQPLFLIEPKK